MNDASARVFHRRDFRKSGKLWERIDPFRLDRWRFCSVYILSGLLQDVSLLVIPIEKIALRSVPALTQLGSPDKDRAQLTTVY